jgi:hypothetical protein
MELIHIKAANYTFETNFKLKNGFTTREIESFTAQLQNFQHIPRKLMKNTHFINCFTFDYKPYHVTIGFKINLIDDYKKYK